MLGAEDFGAEGVAACTSRSPGCARSAKEKAVSTMLLPARFHSRREELSVVR